MTVAELLALYLRNSASEGRHGDAARVLRVRCFGLFETAYGTLDVSDLKPFHLTDFIDAHPGWRSVATKRQNANAVKAAFQWACDQERIGRNPFRSVRYAEAERRPDLPDAIFERMCEGASKPFERVLRFLRLTGCRLGELCRAQWADLDLERGVWFIHCHKARKRTGKGKVVALIPEAVVMLRASAAIVAVATASAQPQWPGAAGGAHSVFLNSRGRPWNSKQLGKTWRALKAKLGIVTMASLHGIRHRFGSAAVANGAPIKLVSAQLGHASVMVTERYYCDLAGELGAIKAAAALAVR